MNFAALFDAASALIVVGGTMLATVLRCGAGVTFDALAVSVIGGERFDGEAARAEVAQHLRAIERDGPLSANPRRMSDAALDHATSALYGRNPVATLIARHEADKAARKAKAAQSATTLAQASELAPAFGMVGTLTSLSQLPVGGAVAGGLNAAIAMAVLTTLYGLLLANLVLAPLARRVERAAAREESERQALIDWLAQRLERALPHSGSHSGSLSSPHARVAQAA